MSKEMVLGDSLKNWTIIMEMLSIGSLQHFMVIVLRKQSDLQLTKKNNLQSVFKSFKNSCDIFENTNRCLKSLDHSCFLRNVSF